MYVSKQSKLIFKATRPEMLIWSTALGSAQFKRGSLSMGVHVEIRGSYSPNDVPLLRYKGAKFMHKY